jgi:single-stranded DNA-specific DHH superfamily exonuclease
MSSDASNSPASMVPVREAEIQPDSPIVPRPKNFFYPADKICFDRSYLDWFGKLEVTYDAFGKPVTPLPNPTVPPRGLNLFTSAKVRQMSREILRKREFVRVEQPVRPVVSLSNYLSAVAHKWDAANADAYLKEFKEDDLPNPMADFAEVLHACERLKAAASGKEKILIYGDYDCDGVTSTTLMTDALRALDIDPERIFHVIPHRIRDGYNLDWRVLTRHLNESGKTSFQPDLVIAVDCGSTAEAAAGEILKAGMDLLIVDHHNLDSAHSLPTDNPRLIHINPKLWLGQPGNDPRQRLENMCASGLVYLLARTLATVYGLQNKWSHSRAVLLAGLATCVDVMKLNGLNRFLLKESLRLANLPDQIKQVPALSVFKQKKGPRDWDLRPVTEQDYGMSWGPVINAAGRMGSAKLALDLLLAEDEEAARGLFKQCNKLNKHRKATEKAMLHEAGLILRRRFNQTGSNGPDGTARLNGKAPAAPDILPQVLVVSKKTWHPGVVGILASRLRDRNFRPTVVNTLHHQNGGDQTGECSWVGSGRSINNAMNPLDLGKAFHALVAGSQIKKGGGHPMAGGLGFADSQRDGLETNLIAAYQRQIMERHLSKSAESADHDDICEDYASDGDIIELAASASDFSPEEWAEIFERIRPLGNGNPCPPLLVEAAELLSVEPRTNNRFAPFGRPDFGESEGENDDEDDDEDEGEDEKKQEKKQEKKKRRDYEDATWLVQVRDLRKPRDFVERLSRENPRDKVAAFVRTNLSSAGKDALARCMDADTKGEFLEPLPGLADDLNRVLRTMPIYDEHRFKNIRLRRQTLHLLGQNLGEIRRLELNRLLLEDAFPEVGKVKNVRMPKVCAYMANFEDKITGKQFQAVWTDLEQAEVTWQHHRFTLARINEEKPPQVPTYFRLQLALQAYVDGKAMSDIIRGREFKRRHLFQVLQCELIARGPDLRPLRMPIINRKAPGTGARR